MEKRMHRRFDQKRDHETEMDGKMVRLIAKVREDLCDSIVPISLTLLNPFERKQIHREFDTDPNVTTKTYRIGEDQYELRLYPVGNLRKYAEKKAEEAMQSGQKVVLPHMSSFERFIVHEALKDNEAIKANSHGEGDDRHIELEPEIFGRGLKRIMKKIKLF
jgi:predicted RNA-binding protein Jag